MTVPMVVIVVALEEPVAVYADAATDGQLARLDEWIRAHPELDELVTRAGALAERKAA